MRRVALQTENSVINFKTGAGPYEAGGGAKRTDKTVT